MRSISCDPVAHPPPFPPLLWQTLRLDLHDGVNVVARQEVAVHFRLQGDNVTAVQECKKRRRKKTAPPATKTLVFLVPVGVDYGRWDNLEEKVGLWSPVLASLT